MFGSGGPAEVKSMLKSVIVSRNSRRINGFTVGGNNRKQSETMYCFS